jgi:pseudaminic acid biosynthesis-associated methylase
MAKQKKKTAKKPAKKNGFSTPQENFWAGEFGDAYTVRNRGAGIVASNAAMFSKILARTGQIGSAIEFGANVGLNLEALRLLQPKIKLAAVEINASAVQTLKKLGRIEVHHGSIMDFRTAKPFDLSFVKGVLIHINPDELKRVYSALYKSSHRYILIAEYYNPSPVSIPYRGHADRLFKRDFAGEMLETYRDLSLVDYGFVYRRDPNFPQDDLTWFLLEKKKK